MDLLNVREPVKGEPIRADFGRDICRALRAARVIAGPGVRVDHGPAGQRVTLISARSAGAATQLDPWHLEIIYDGSDYTATVTRLYTGFGTAADEFNGGAPATLVLTRTAGKRFLGAEINMQTHVVTLAEGATFASITDAIPPRGSVVVKLPLYEFYKSTTGGYQIVGPLWNMPVIAWHE
jgi:hypothetical protein